MFLLLCINTERKTFTGTVVSPSAPRTEAGIYWGYSVRLASGLSAVFSEGPYQEGYDVTLGTSERGVDVDKLQLSEFRLVEETNTVSLQ